MPEPGMGGNNDGGASESRSRGNGFGGGTRGGNVSGRGALSGASRSVSGKSVNSGLAPVEDRGVPAPTNGPNAPIGSAMSGFNKAVSALGSVAKGAKIGASLFGAPGAVIGGLAGLAFGMNDKKSAAQPSVNSFAPRRSLTAEGLGRAGSGSVGEGPGAPPVNVPSDAPSGNVVSDAPGLASVAASPYTPKEYTQSTAYQNIAVTPRPGIDPMWYYRTGGQA